MRLDELKTGESGTILHVGGRGALRRRLMDMGLTPGTTVFILKVAPLGDPVVLYMRGYELTLRKEDAANIAVTRVPSEGYLHNPVHGRRRRFRGGRL